jgi:Zn-dependent protease with chaperone function
VSEFAHPSTFEPQPLPRDRQSFFDAQRRNRRAAWRLSALCVLAVALMGIPLALLTTPLIYAVVLIVADIINIFSPLPHAFWQQAEEAAHFGLAALAWLLEHKTAPPQALALGAFLMLAPGAILSLVVWLGISALFRRGGVGGALLALNAREPNQADLKELRLADVAQEMAIAAGLPPPRVMLVDAPGANAAAIGLSPADARIVVTRRLIDDLSRDELEGALAHLIASIGNGDLRVAFQLTAVFETYGVLLAMINSPFGPQSRRTLWRIVRYGLAGSGTSQDGAQEASAVAAILTRNIGLDTDDIDRFFDSNSKKSVLRSIRNFILFPFFFTNAAIKLSLWFFSLTVLGPAVALLWRTRQYLADASAVQLTRNPDGLAGALQKLSEDAGAIRGGEWASHLFLVNPTSSDRLGGPSARQKEILAQAWAASAQHTATTAPQRGSANFEAILNEALPTYRAAMAGDAQAIARISAVRQAMSTLDPALAAQIPDPADLAAARKGDVTAIARLKGFRRQVASQAQTPSQSQPQSDAGQSSGMSSLSFLGFHPSLKRRLKRLDRMGAHVNLAAANRKVWIVTAVLALIFAPLLLLLVALFLLLIGIMTMASLAFLAIWLAVIHKLFTLVAYRK